MRRFGDADVVAVGLRHLLHAVGAFEQRHGEHDLRKLVVVALQLASHEQVEFLVGAAEFDVGLERHRVVALRDGVEQLVHGDGLLFGEALVEVFALEHLRDRELGGQAHEAFVAELAQPLAVEADFGLVAVENLEDLRLVGFGVGVDLLAGERRARGDAARGIADEAGEVSDQEDDGVAHVLKVLELADEHGVADVQVGRGGIESGFDAHGLAGSDGALDALAQVALANDLGGALAEVGQLLVDGWELRHKD